MEVIGNEGDSRDNRNSREKRKKGNNRKKREALRRYSGVCIHPHLTEHSLEHS